MTSKELFVSLITNLSLGIIKVIGGFLTNSKTLISDGIHCLSDMGTDVIGILGTKLSKKKPDKEHPFGHGKIEYVTSMLMSIFIIILGISCMINSFEIKSADTNYIALIILFFCILVKLLLSHYLIGQGKRLNNSILLTNGTESRYDAYSSMFALIFVALSLIFESKFINYDIIGSVLIGILTIKIGVQLFIKNIQSVIGEVNTDKERQEQLKNIVLENKKVSIKRLTILKYGYYESVIIDLFVKPSMKIKEAYEIENKIKKELKKDERIKYVTISYAPKNII